MLLAAALIVIVVVSAFIFLPRGNQASAIVQPTDSPVSSMTPSATINPRNPDAVVPKPITPSKSPDESNRVPGIIETALEISSATWLTIAKIAWRYYEPGVGVDTKTGLPWTGKGSPFMTDWDLGVYVQAVVDAAKLGIIDNSTFNARMDKVLTWIETRELNDAGYPYWFYRADDGQVWHQSSDVEGFLVDIADTGRLFVALNSLKVYSQTVSPTLASRVDTVVYNQNGNRSDYHALVPAVRADSQTAISIYSYLVTSGFECFWPTELAGASARILTNIFADSTGTTATPEGVTLPKAKITGDPLLSVFFALDNKDPDLFKLVNLTYSAHEAYYNATRQFRAFGEGPSFSTDWQWEWVVLPDGRTWVPLTEAEEPTDCSPMIFTKVAFSFLAMYNTDYARNMVVYLETNMSDLAYGYFEGANEEGATFHSFGSLTNGLILDAALYYVQNTPY